MIHGSDGPAKRTQFVTVLAWVLICFTGFWVAGAVVGTVVLNIILPLPAMAARGAGTDATAMFLSLRMLPAVLGLFMAFALACAVGLLKRHDWARRAWIVLFALGIGFHAVASAFFLQGTFLHPSPGSDGDVGFAQMMRLMVIPMVVGALGIAVLFGWLIQRLSSVGVRQEFRGGIAI